jgi:hypothetical protein
VDPAAAEEASVRRPIVERAEATRVLAEAKRLYGVAELVQARRIIGGVDSAALAHKSLSLALGLLVRLNGEEAPGDHANLVERARAISAEQKLLEEDLGAELLVINEMRERFVQIGADTTAADDRRYNRAFVRSAEWFGATKAYLDQQLPPQNLDIWRRSKMGIAIVVTFAAGFAVGRHVSPRPTPARPVISQTANPIAPTGPAFTATFFRDTSFREAALSRRDTSIAFDWEGESPAESLPNDHFGVRWNGILNIREEGKYTFHLTSDDGSRLFIDEMLTIDNWGNHGPVTRVGSMDLPVGKHAIRVDFFDEIGGALVKLEWSSERFSQRLLTGTDLAEEGAAEATSAGLPAARAQ